MIVRPRAEVLKQAVGDSSSVELLQEVIARAEDLRAHLRDADRAQELTDAAARDLSIAITHLEDSRTRLNAAGYRLNGRFSISDAER
jgi:hypothetical protein